MFEVIYSSTGDLETSERITLFGGGTLHIEEIGFTAHSPVIGSFEASLYPESD